MAGPIFLHSNAHMLQLTITDIEFVKEFVVCKSIVLGKPSITSKVLGPLLGKGILSSNGAIWEHQRKIIAPELYLDKVKVRITLTLSYTITLWLYKAPALL